MKRLLTMALLAASPVAAQEVRDCDEMAAVEAVPEPWADHTQTFAGGQVRLAVIDTLEPAAAAVQLVILSPPFDELGVRQCKMVGSEGGLGFGGMTLDGIESSYDPETGLTWGVPVRVYDESAGGFFDTYLWVTLNQSTGAITAGY